MKRHNPAWDNMMAARARGLAQPATQPATQPQATEDNALLLASFPRGDREETRVQLKIFNGRPFVDVRRWFVDRDGVFRPTSKGQSIRLGEIDTLIAALERAKSEAGPT